MYDAVLSVGLPGLPGLPSMLSPAGRSSSSPLEERYVSRVRMDASPPSTAAAAGVGGNPKDASDVPTLWTVEAKSIRSNLFDSLRSRWKLTLLANDSGTNARDSCDVSCNTNDTTMTNASCGVNFDVEIRVSNPLVSLTLDQVLEDVARRQVEAFERRCGEVLIRS